MPYDNNGNHHNTNDDGGVISALRKDMMEIWNVIEEEEEDVSLTQHPPSLDDMTQQVQSLLQFMDQYQTFSPLLKNRLNDENDKGNGESSFHTNDSKHEPNNQVDSSVLHHSTVVSSSSSSSSSLILPRDGLDVPIEPNGTHHHHSTNNNNNNNTVMDASSPLLDRVDDDDDDPSVSHIATFGHAERDQLRRWVTQVRQAVHEWVQAHRHYVVTQAAAATPPQHNDDDNGNHHPKLQIMQQQYEQTIVSLNDIIQEQRRRIHKLEQQQQQLVPSHATHGIDTATRDSTVEWPQSRRRVDHPPPSLASPPPHTRHPTATTTTAVVIKTKNCKRIAHANGTVHEIYYDDRSGRGSSRPRLYEIIRFYNGDVKMTPGDHHHDDDEVVVEETYYYYATSGVIQIAKRPRPRPSSSPTTTKNLPPTRIEYHYPNGQIEYHIGTERVIQFPNGRTTRMTTTTTDPKNVEARPRGTR